jgi:hypothetical protein
MSKFANLSPADRALFEASERWNPYLHQQEQQQPRTSAGTYDAAEEQRIYDAFCANEHKPAPAGEPFPGRCAKGYKFTAAEVEIFNLHGREALHRHLSAEAKR